MAHFELIPTGLEGLALFQRRTLGDSRGHLMRMFCAEELHPLGWQGEIAQINLTYTASRATIRGMHFQREPFAEIKIVTCLKGQIFDVAVDLRPNSATFLQWRGEVLSKDNRRSFYIPKGFAHGFRALTDDVEMLYYHSRPYAPDSEDGIMPLDADLNIAWPLPVGLMSDRDKALPSAQDYQRNTL